VCDLTPAFELSGPTISHHLWILREAGLVEADRRGTWIYYRPVRVRLTVLSQLLDTSELATV
jgi:ArsR family transcriptional regulator